jgi:hypothetical protein
MRHAVGTALVVSLSTFATLGLTSVGEVQAQVAQPDYGAGPGVAASRPSTADPVPAQAGTVQQAVPEVRSAIPPVRAGGPSVQQAGQVAATTLPRTGGAATGESNPWVLATLGTMLVGLLGLIGATRAPAHRST